MIRPGLRDPRQGPNRTKALGQQMRPMVRQKRPPMLGGGFRRPVAGPGARWMSGQRSSPMNFLQERLQALGMGQRAAMTPMGGPMQPDGGDYGLDAGMQPLPPPPSVGGDRFHPLLPPGMGPQQGPTSPVAIPQGVMPQAGWQPVAPGSDMMEPSMRDTPVFQGGLAGLIPLGGGQYIDPQSGMIHGLGGGGRAF